MGIKGLMKFLQDNAPKAVREVHGPEAYTGRILAIDASMCLYQFLIIIRESRSGMFANLLNQQGQVTSHLAGFLTRTIRLMEAGIKPVYVFDGKPPELKANELSARQARREEAAAEVKEAKELGDEELYIRRTKMAVRVTEVQVQQAKRLLRLMGVPIIEAPSEAEATCAALCKAGKVHAAATEDSDCLTFGAPLLVRNILASEAQKKPIYEVNLAIALDQLGLNMDQFVDFCILCGCDYCDGISGVGPITALRLLLKYGSLEKVVEAYSKVARDDCFLPLAQAARELFHNCEVIADPEAVGVELTWREPDFAQLTSFLVEENNFSAERVARLCARLRAAKTKTKQQPLERFFVRHPPTVSDGDRFDPNRKRTAPQGMKAQAKAKAKSGVKRIACEDEAGKASEPKLQKCLGTSSEVKARTRHAGSAERANPW